MALMYDQSCVSGQKLSMTTLNGKENVHILANSRLKACKLVPFPLDSQEGLSNVLRAEAANRLFTAFRSRKAGKFNRVKISSSKSIWSTTPAAAEAFFARGVLWFSRRSSQSIDAV